MYRHVWWELQSSHAEDDEAGDATVVHTETESYHRRSKVSNQSLLLFFVLSVLLPQLLLTRLRKRHSSSFCSNQGHTALCIHHIGWCCGLAPLQFAALCVYFVLQKESLLFHKPNRGREDPWAVGPNDKQAGKKKIKCEHVTLFYTSNDDGRKKFNTWRYNSHMQERESTIHDWWFYNPTIDWLKVNSRVLLFLSCCWWCSSLQKFDDTFLSNCDPCDIYLQLLVNKDDVLPKTQGGGDDMEVKEGWGGGGVVYGGGEGFTDATLTSLSMILVSEVNSDWSRTLP